MSKLFSLRLNDFSTILINGLIISGSVGGILALQSLYLNPQNKSLTSTDYQRRTADEKSALNVFRRTPSLGFDNLLADWLYLQFIQYFGDNEARDKSDYSLLSEYFQQLVERDPRFNDAISKLDVALSLFAGDPQKSVEILTQALQNQPAKFETPIRSYYLWRAKGNNELLLLGDTESAKKSYYQSILSAKAYNDENSKRIMEISQRSIDFLEKNPDSKLARIGAWVTVLANRPDPKTMKRVIREIEALGGRVIFNPTNGEIKVQLPKGVN
jgi:hypothetical protein